MNGIGYDNRCWLLYVMAPVRKRLKMNLRFEENSSTTWPQLVVFEEGRRWVDTVRARLAGLPLRVRHSVAALDALQLLRSERSSVVLAELGLRPIDVLRLIEELGQQSAGHTVLVVARSNHAELELPARELGAGAFLVEPLAAMQVAGFVETVLRRKWRLERN